MGYRLSTRSQKQTPFAPAMILCGLELEQLHLQMLSGDLTQTEARTRRMQQFFGSFQISLTDEVALAEHELFRYDSDQAFEFVQGAEEILRRLRELEMRMAIVTNNLVSEQINKLKFHIISKSWVNNKFPPPPST